MLETLERRDVMAVLYWDTNGATPGLGGSGTWNTTAATWTADPNGASATQAWNNAAGNTAVFAGTAGTVTLGTGVTAAAVTFNSNNYTLTSNTLTLTGAAQVNVAASNSATINSKIAGTVGLNKVGTGTLTLSGNNTYSGNNTIGAGIVVMSHANALGTGAVSVNGTTNGYAQLRLSGGITTASSQALTLSGANATNRAFLASVGGATNTWGGPITLAGANDEFNNGGTDNLVLNGSITSSSNTGFSARGSDTTTINGVVNIGMGSVAVNDSAILLVNSTGNTWGATTIAGSGTTLKLGANNALPTGTTVAMNALAAGNTITFDLNGRNQQIAGLSDNGLGTRRIGNSSTSANGTLTVTSASTFGGVIQDVLDSGNKNVALTVGGGTLTLTGANTYSGATTISSGATLQVGSGGTTGTLGTGAVTTSGTLAFNRSDDLTVANVIGGGGALVKSGAGTLTVSGSSSYTGGTQINAGIVVMSHANALGTGAVSVNGTTNGYAQLRLSGGITTASSQALTLSGANATNRAFLASVGGATNTWGGPITLAGANDEFNNGGTDNLVLNGSITSSSNTGFSARGSDTTTINGVVNIGMGSVAVNDSAILLVNSTGNTWGATTIAGSGTTLKLGANNALPTGTAVALNALAAGNTITFDLNGRNQQIAGLSDNGLGTRRIGNSSTSANGTLTVSSMGSSTFGGVIQDALDSGAKNVALTVGGGTLTLTGANTYSGATTINSGATLQVGNGGATGSLGAGAVVDNGTLTFNRTGTLTVSNVISGSGSFVMQGTGSLTMSGANAYTGGTTVNAGTVNVLGNQSAANGGWSIGPTAAIAATVNFQAGSTIDVAAGKQIRIGNASATGTATQTLNVAGSVTNDGTLYVGRPGVVNVNSGGIWNQTAGMSLNGSGSYSSSLAVKTGATFNYTGATAIGVNPAPLSSANAGNATLAIDGTGVFTTGIGFANGTATSTGSANLTLTNGGTLRLTADVSTLTTTVGSPFRITLGTGGGMIDTQAFSTNVSGVVSGVGALTKTGAGALTLSAANTYSGNTTVTGGALRITKSTSLGTGAKTVNLTNNLGELHLDGSGGAITLANNISFVTSGLHGVIFNDAGNNTINGAFNLSAGGGDTTIYSNAGSLTLGGNLNLTASDRNLNLRGAGSGVIKGNITNSATSLSVVKSDAGTWTLSGTNTFSGGATVNSGTLVAAVSSARNSLGAGAVAVSAGSTLQLNSTETALNAVTSVTNTFTGAGLLKLNFAAGANSRNTSMNNVSAFTGTIELASAGPTGDKWRVNNLGTLNSALVVGSGAQLYAQAGTTTFSQGITLAGTGNSENRGAIRLLGNVGGNISLAANASIGAEGGTLTGDISSAAGAKSLTVGTANSNTFATNMLAGTLADGAGTLALKVYNNNSGAVFIAGSKANTYSGGTTLLNSISGTRLVVGAVSGTPYGSGPITIGQAATDKAGIYFATANQTLANDIVMNTAVGTDRPGIRTDVAGVTLSGKVTANLAPVTFSTNGTGSFKLTGQVTGSQGLTLNNTYGTSIAVTLANAAGTNNYVGATTIAGTKGTLALGAANQIPNGASVGGLANNGTFKLNGFSEQVNGLSGNGTVDGVSGSPTFTVGDNNATSTFGGVIKNTAGALALAKTGSGTLTLTGASTFSGGTTVGAGTLRLNNAAAGTGEIKIGNGTLSLFRSGVTTTFANAIRSIAGTVGALAVDGSGSNTGTGTNSTYATGTITVDGTLTVSRTTGGTGSTLFSSLLAGSGTLKVGNTNGGTAPSTSAFGRLHFSNTGNTFNGAVDVLSGGNFLNLKTSPTYASVNVAAGGYVTLLGGTSTTVGALTGAGNITKNAAANTATLVVGNGNASGDFSGVIAHNLLGGTGTVALTKTGTGTQVLSGSNTYTGATNINAGVLNIRSAGALGTASSGTTVAAGAALEIQGGITVASESLSLAGTGISDGGALRNISGDNAFEGPVTHVGSTRINSDSGTLTVPNEVTGLSGLLIGGAGTVIVNGLVGGSQPPVATTPSSVPVVVNEDAANVVLNVYDFFADPDDADDTLQYFVDWFDDSELFDSVDLDTETGELTLDFADDAVGTTTIYLWAWDPVSNLGSNSFDVTINAVDDPPEAFYLEPLELYGDGSSATFSLEDFLYDVDSDIADFIVAATSSDTNLLTVSVDPETGAITVTPIENIDGSGTLTLEITYGPGLVLTVDYSFTVTDINDLPTTVDALPNNEELDVQASPIAENSGLTTAINLFPYFEDAETADADLEYEVVYVSHPDLFIGEPIVDSSGNLKVDPNGDDFDYGGSIVTISATDEGGYSTYLSVLIVVSSENDLPEPVASASNSIDAHDTDAPRLYDLSAIFHDDEWGSYLDYEVDNSNTDLLEAAIFDGDQLLLTFEPGKVGTATITITGTDEVTDNDDPPVFTLTVNVLASTPVVSIERVQNGVETDGARDGKFRITRFGGDYSQSFVVDVVLTGTAEADADYVAPTNFTIPADETELIVDIAAIDDIAVESDETVHAEIQSSTAYSIGAADADLTLFDDDVSSTPRISILRIEGTVENSGTPGKVVFLRQGGNIAASLTVNVSVGSDSYFTVDGGPISTVTFAANSTEAEVSISSVNDSDASSENRERYAYVTLGTGANYTLPGETLAKIPVIDEDDITTPGRVHILKYINPVEGQDGRFELIHLGPDPIFSATGTVFHPSGYGSTATFGTDFSQPAEGTNFTYTTSSITFRSLADNTPEIEEKFVFSLSFFIPSGFDNIAPLFASPQQASLSIIYDDLVAPPTFRVVDKTPATEGGDDGELIILGLGGSPGTNYTVNYDNSGTVAAKATPVDDYSGASSSGTLSLHRGVNTVSISAEDDDTPELNEIAVITLLADTASTPQYSVASPAIPGVTIHDNDFAVAVDLVIDGLSEALEESPGAFLGVNDDFDEGNEYQKQEFIGGIEVAVGPAGSADNIPNHNRHDRMVFGDSELRAGKLKLTPSGERTSGTLAWIVPDNMKVWWLRNGRWVEATGSYDDVIPNGEWIDIWVEGLEVGAGDIMATYQTPSFEPEADWVKVNVVSIDADMDSDNTGTIDHSDLEDLIEWLGATSPYGAYVSGQDLVPLSIDIGGVSTSDSSFKVSLEYSADEMSVSRPGGTVIAPGELVALSVLQQGLFVSGHFSQLSPLSIAASLYYSVAGIAPVLLAADFVGARPVMPELAGIDYIQVAEDGFGDLKKNTNPGVSRSANGQLVAAGSNGHQLFPDAKLKPDMTVQSLGNNRVRVRATLKPETVTEAMIGNNKYVVWFKTFDVDDADSNTTIDPNDNGNPNRGFDNRGRLKNGQHGPVSDDTRKPGASSQAGGYAGLLRGNKGRNGQGVLQLDNDAFPVTNSFIQSEVDPQDATKKIYFAEVDLYTSYSPGDNYRLAAFVAPGELGDTSPVELKALENDSNSTDVPAAGGSDARDVGPNKVSPNSDLGRFLTANGMVSPLLTVWRRLHVEKDFMATGSATATDMDFKAGVVRTVRRVGQTNEYDVTVEMSPFEYQSFAGGNLVAGAASWPIIDYFPQIPTVPVDVVRLAPPVPLPAPGQAPPPAPPPFYPRLANGTIVVDVRGLPAGQAGNTVWYSADDGDFEDQVEIITQTPKPNGDFTITIGPVTGHTLPEKIRGGYFLISSVSNFRITSPGGAPALVRGTAVTAYQDEFAIGPGGVVTLRDNPTGNPADTNNPYGAFAKSAMALQMQDSPDRALNRFADAYIQPDYNALKHWSDEQIPFIAHFSSETETIANNKEVMDDFEPLAIQPIPPPPAPALAPTYRDSYDLEKDRFWVAYIFSAFEPDRGADGDPYYLTPVVTNPAQRTGDRTTPGTTNFNPLSPNDRQASAIFFETTRDAARISNRPLDQFIALVTAHEVGHQLGLGHPPVFVGSDIMGVDRNPNSTHNLAAKNFSNTDIGTMRSRVRSPGGIDFNLPD